MPTHDELPPETPQDRDPAAARSTRAQGHADAGDAPARNDTDEDGLLDDLLSEEGLIGEHDERQLPNEPPATERPPSSRAALLIATLLTCAAAWLAQGLVLPVLLALFFALVGNPVIRALQRVKIPRFIGALLVLSAGLFVTGALVNQLMAPAAEWVRQVPKEMREIAPKLRQLAKPMREANKVAENIASAAGGEARPVQVVRTQAHDPYRALASTPRIAAAILAVVLLTFFFMVYGENLQRNAIALLHSRQQKKLTVEILQSMEQELSRYVFTITLINAVVGLVFAVCLVLLDMPLDEALLWGTMAAILNFAPYVGPLLGIGIMLLIGLTTFDDWMALAPAAVYLGLHTLEGQIITPIVLGKRMRLSPLVLIVALMVFGTLWGIIGLLLAVPLLVCVKLVLERIEGMDGWARLLE